MKCAIVSLILAMCVVAVAVTYLNGHSTNAGMPLVQSSATKQPAWRLYTPCPIDRRNVPFLKPEERT